jgi:hypothetical protein
VSEQPLDPEVNALANALAHLQPRPAMLDRDALLFRAGQASASRGWKWPLAAFASLLIAVGLGVTLLVRPQPIVSERIVYIQVPVAAVETTTEPKPEPPTPVVVEWTLHEAETPLPLSNYQRLEEHLLRWGFDGLPTAPHIPSPKETRESLLQSL